MDLGYGSDLLRGAVQFGRAVEQMTDGTPPRDAAVLPTYIDTSAAGSCSKRNPLSDTLGTITRIEIWNKAGGDIAARSPRFVRFGLPGTLSSER